MARVPDLPPEWYHARFQAVGRAQSRYLVLLLVISAYTFGLDFTTGDTVSVTALGLPPIPKRVVDAAAMVVLSVLLLALFGSFRAARVAFAELLTRLGQQGVGASMYQVDEHPNVADFLSFATLGGERPGRWTRAGAFVFYPLPVLAVVGWTGTLWWRGVTGAPGRLVWVYRVSTLLIASVLWGTGWFLRRRWELFRQRPRT